MLILYFTEIKINLVIYQNMEKKDELNRRIFSCSFFREQQK
jgi:hypothetical protein